MAFIKITQALSHRPYHTGLIIYSLTEEREIFLYSVRVQRQQSNGNILAWNRIFTVTVRTRLLVPACGWRGQHNT